MWPSEKGGWLRELRRPTVAWVIRSLVLPLQEEKVAHAKTKVLLAKEEEKLQFALGEVEVLSKQLEKEKLAFEKA